MLRVVGAEEVARRLNYPACIPLMRAAMADFSAGKTKQTLREIIPLKGDDAFGVMPGALAEARGFGAKLISVFPHNFAAGGPSHQGVVVVFDAYTGAPAGVVDAGEVTAIRTAAASAMATDLLARPGAARLALLGYGRQAREHVRALRQVRSLAGVTVWGRDAGRAAEFVRGVAAELEEDGAEIVIEAAPSARAAVEAADIVCTLTPATEPLLHGAWLAAGAHVNLVGAGHAGQAEADVELVARARFYVDSRPGVLAQGGEFLRALAAGAVSETHIAGEIGEVVLGRAVGRGSESEITVYKSLGHVVQDLACAEYLLARPGPG